ncbi:GDSL-type esterase/lipase family protein [Cohnella fermenti]|nr:GDSL-type esterase/lipase family protein [Cohnella fermenti]
MRYEQVELHNVVAVENNQLCPGLLLQRFPETVRASMSERGRFISQQASGCEIRFVTEANQFRLSLSSVEGSGDVMIFQGDYFHSHHSLSGSDGAIKTIHLENKLNPAGIDPAAMTGQRFSHRVWRIFLCRYTARFHGVEAFGCPIRPPQPEEVPAKRWLAYGSSITHGGAALNNYNSYVQQAARRLGVDVLNKGLGGACLCEPEVADYLSSLNDWDFATLELGVNMRGAFAPEEFRARVQYVVDTICSRHPGKPVVLVTVFPNAATHEREPSLAGENQKAYGHILREIADQGRYPQLHLLEGSQILTDFAGLTCDLLHPSEYGHTIMGENLSRLLQPIIMDVGTPVI